MDVAVIGAGYTGLVASYRLSQAGYRVTLFEKQPGVGGLAGDFTMHGVHVEMAYHFLYRTDQYIGGLLEELGLHDVLVFSDSSVCVFYQGKVYPFNGALDLLTFTPLSFIDRIRAGVTVLILQKTRQTWRKLSRLTATQWLKKWAGTSVYDIIWAPLLKGKFDRYYEQISMQWLWGRIMQRADSKRPGEKTEKLGQIRGGFHALTQALVDQLEARDVPVLTRTPVSSLQRNPATGKIEFDAGGVPQSFDRVLFTGPSPVFADLIDGNPEPEPEYLEQLRGVPYLGAIVAIFSSDQEISPYYWHNISEMDWPFLVFINLTKLRDKADFAGKHIYYLAAYVPHEHAYFSMPKDELLALWYDALAKMWPDFDRGQLLEQHLFRFRYAQHVVGCGYEATIPDYRSPVPGVYLANFSQIFPIDRGTNMAINEAAKVTRVIAADGAPTPGPKAAEPARKAVGSAS